MKKIIFTLCAILLIAYVYPQRVSELETRTKCKNLKNRSVKISKFDIQSDHENNYDVKFYWLDLAVERTSTNVEGNVTINAVVKINPLDTFVVELIDELTVDSAKINNLTKAVMHSNGLVKIPLGTPITIGSSFSAKIFYHGGASSGGFFSGISHENSPSWGNEVVWTLSEPFNANQWWPCKQDLNDKADSSWVFITTDNTNKAGSNGLLTAITTMPNNKLRYEWKSRNPIDYYLISFAVAKYVDYTIYAHPAGTTDSVMIQNYIYDNPQTLPYFKSFIDSTAPMIELYSSLFGMYPYINEKYGHCMAPLSGGMEHQTMTTLGFFTFDLVCHELAHMWFGDHVTCNSWSDIWINEGFASYSEYLAHQYLRSWAKAQSDMADVHENVLSVSDGSVYVPFSQTNDELRIFDSRLSYDKGSAIIHNIRFELQDDSVFFKTLKDFQNIYSDSTAGGDDFKAVLEANSSKDFTDFFNQWYYGEGYPIYSLLWHQINDTLYFTSAQTTSSSTTTLFKMLMEYKLISPDGDTLIKVYQTNNVNSFKIPTHKNITGMVVDPNNWVLNTVGSIIQGIEDFRNSVNFMTYPNPCNSSLNILLSKNPSDKIHLEIFDVYGEKVYERIET
ncbi:MAG: M1 family metallopeptidase, partial [Bacteroidetes bacterium]|nr:M1 family metallopeptidase [Bacteroidota bacterium]